MRYVLICAVLVISLGIYAREAKTTAEPQSNVPSGHSVTKSSGDSAGDGPEDKDQTSRGGKQGKDHKGKGKLEH